MVSKFGPNAQAIASKVENAVKSALLKQSNYFESLNFRYFGPVDGHDVVHLAKVLDDLKDIPGPKILHCLTKKEKVINQQRKVAQLSGTPQVYSIRKLVKSSRIPRKSPQAPKYQDVFGKTIVELAEKNEKIMGITPAMLTGSSLTYMMEQMPDRTFDVGIAEQHAVTFSAGLATQGLLPFCNIYSTFMQRAYDQVIHDVALQNLNVVFCLDRGGLVGADGATHHGAYDLAYFRCIPNMIVSAPMNEQELRNLMYTAQLKECGPFSIRYPRGNGVMLDWETPFEEIIIGEGRQISEGNEVAILSIGHPGNFTTKARENMEQKGYSIAQYDMRFVKPLDEKLLHQVFKKHNKVITVEDGCLQGGFGSAILEFMADYNYQAEVKRLGVPDDFIHHGTQAELWRECNYDSQAIEEAIQQLVGVKKVATTA